MFEQCEAVNGSVGGGRVRDIELADWVDWIRVGNECKKSELAARHGMREVLRFRGRYTAS